MLYVLCKASIEPDWSHATLWFRNPDCVFEKPHRICLFDKCQIDMMMSKFVNAPLPYDLNDLPINHIPEEFQSLHAEYVEVNIGLHKHVTRKTKNKRPVFTRCVYVFAPMVKVDRPCERWAYLQSPSQLAQEQINRYWIPVDED